MSDLEKDFGPYAFYIERLQGMTFDIPEALTDALFKLAQAGLWNLPNGGKYEAVVQARTWRADYEERLVTGWGLSPMALRNAFPKYEEAFVTTAWEKLNTRFGYKLRVCAALLQEPGRFHSDLERIGREARAMKTSTDVVQSGIVSEFCEAILNRDFAVLVGNNFSKESYDWVDELALYLLPLQEHIKFLEEEDDLDPNTEFNLNVRLIQTAIDGEVLKRWGDDDVVANMRHTAGMCGSSWARLGMEVAHPLCKVCTRIEDVRKATAALQEELREKHFYIDCFNPTFESLEEVAAYREQVLKQEEEFAKAGEEIVTEPEEVVDPFVEDVIYLVEGLTKLGVSPNKAAEVASKLMTSPTS